MQLLRIKYFLVAMLSIVTASKSYSLECDLLDINTGKVIKLSGNQLGKSLPSSYPNYATYRCEISLTEKDYQDKYLYFGQVGDAASLKVLTPNGRKRVFFHGLYKDNIKITYKRYIPFFVRADFFFDDPGTYLIELTFKNIFPPQKGLMSGVPAIISFKKLIFKFLLDTRFITYYLLLTFFLLIMFLDDFLSEKKDLISYIFLVSTSFYFLMLSAIPRTFLHPLISYKLHIVAHLFHYTSFIKIIEKQYRWKGRGKVLLNIFLSLMLPCLIMVVLNKSYFPVKLLGLFYFMGFSVPLAMISFYSLKNEIEYIKRAKNSKLVELSLVAIFLIYTWDFTNMSFWNSREIYISHIVGILIILFLYKIFQNDNMKLREIFDQVKEDLKNLTYSCYLSDYSDHSSTLDNVSDKLSDYFKSSHLSITYVRNNKLFYAGSNEEYKKTFNKIALDIEKTEFIKNLESKDIGCYFFKKGSENIIIVKKNFETDLSYSFYLSMTGFYDNHIPNYIESMLERTGTSLDILYQSYIFKENIIKQNIMLKLSRDKVDELQRTSEEFFYKNFEFLKNSSKTIIIRGDLSFSSSLNQIYGANVIDKIVNSYYSSIWGRHKDSGILMNKKDGDEIFFIFPQLSYDNDGEECYRRAIQFFFDLAGHKDETEKIANKLGVNQPVLFKFAMNDVNGDVTSLFGKRHINLIQDSSIDIVSRILSSVVMAGESVITSSIYDKLFPDEKIKTVKLAPHRLRGTLDSVSLYLLFGKSFSND